MEMSRKDASSTKSLKNRGAVHTASGRSQVQARPGSPSSPGQARAADLAAVFGGGPTTPPFQLVQAIQPQGGNLAAKWNLPAELPAAESLPHRVQLRARPLSFAIFCLPRVLELEILNTLTFKDRLEADDKMRPGTGAGTGRWS